MIGPNSASTARATSSRTAAPTTVHTKVLSRDCQFVLEVICLNAHRLAIGVKYEARDLIGPDIWDSLPPAKRKALGRCVSKLVAQGLLPLAPAGLNSARHNVYRRV